MREVHKQNVEEKRVDNEIQCEPKDEVKIKVLVAQLYPALCDSMNCSPSVSSVHGIFQARILEWCAIPFSRASSLLRDLTKVYCIAGRFFTV